MSVAGGLFLDVVSSLAGILWLPAALVLAAAGAALVLDAFGRPSAAVAIVGLAASVAAALCVAAALETPLQQAVPGVYGGGGLAGAGAAMYALAALAAATGMRTLPSSVRGGAAALVALSGAACQALAGAVDAVVMVLALETLAITGYGLVSASGTRASGEVGMRYFIQGSVAAGLLVFGLAGVVAVGGGETSYEALTATIASSPAAAAGVLGMLFVAALAFKTGAVPFHSWVPDAYETAEPGVAVFLAGAPKIAAVTAAWVLFVRTVWASEPFADVRTAIAIAAAASVVVGNLAALKQTRLGRLLGYSAIAQAGYALIGVAAGAVGTGLLVASYALAAAVAFGVAAVLKEETGSDPSIEDLAGLASRRPALAAALAAAMLSLTGMPLTVGFVGKLWVFYGAIGAGLTWLAVIGALGSVVSFGYYGRVIQAAYFAEPQTEPAADAADGAPEAADDEPLQPDVPRPRAWPFVAAAAAIVIAGVAPLVFGFEQIVRFFMV